MDWFGSTASRPVGAWFESTKVFAGSEPDFVYCVRWALSDQSLEEPFWKLLCGHSRSARGASLIAVHCPFMAYPFFFLQVRCNWNSNFRNTITFTPFRVDMGAATSVNFNGDDVTTAMSVQVGRGPFAPVIAEGLVQIGDTLTLVIYLQTKDITLEIQVLDCTAADGKNRNKIQLTDESGCVLKEKLISAWQTTRETQNSAAQIAYAYLTAFKFPDDYIVSCGRYNQYHLWFG